MAPKTEDVEVISFRVPKDVLEKFDRIAEMERRPRASMLRAMMENSINAITIVSRNLEWQVKMMADLEAKYPDSPQLEYRRGQLHAMKHLLVIFFGEQTKDKILQTVREKTGLPIPHILPLGPDGERYGLDMDAG
jgi:predicted transcriptional regulator